MPPAIKSPIRDFMERMADRRGLSRGMMYKTCGYSLAQGNHFENGAKVISDRFVKLMTERIRLTNAERNDLDEVRQWRRPDRVDSQPKRVVKTLSAHRFDVTVALINMLHTAPMTRLDEIVKALRIRL